MLRLRLVFLASNLKDFAERLRGTTFEELKADAEQAMSIYNIGTDKATDPTAGLGGNGPKTSRKTLLDALSRVALAGNSEKERLNKWHFRMRCPLNREDRHQGTTSVSD